MTEHHISDTTERLQGLDDFIHTVMRDWKAPGLAIAVVKESEIIYMQGFGQRDTAQNLPVTPETLFPIASCTKAFTTAAMSILVDQGKLNWDTPVRTYIPGFKLYDLAATEHVTPRDLVSHRTGLPRHDLAWYNNTSVTRRELIERLQYLEPTKDLRSFWQYQNLMYMAAGYLVEIISGQTWEAFVQQNILQPLEMRQSNFDILQTIREASDYAHPYKENGDEIKEIPFYTAQSAIAPAAAIVSSVREMSNWVLLHLNGGKYHGTRIISEQQVQQIHTPQMVVPQMNQYHEIPYASYAMGWVVEPYRGFPMIDHSGGIDGFRALTTLFPNEKIGIVVLSNMLQLNIPEILTYHVFERLVGLDRTPWSERYLKEHSGFKDAEQKGKEESKSKRIAGTNPSHPLNAYTGVFEHPGYGIFSVALGEGRLQGTFNDMTFPIQHYHYDIFEIEMERWGKTMRISFLTNVKGSIETLIAPFEPTGSDIVFKRAPERRMLSRDFLEQFAGIYVFMQMQIGIAFMEDHVLSASIPGEPDYELEPYQGSEFLAKGISGVSFEFQYDASGAVTGVTASLPDGVFSATKKG